MWRRQRRLGSRVVRAASIRPVRMRDAAVGWPLHIKSMKLTLTTQVMRWTHHVRWIREMTVIVWHYWEQEKEREEEGNEEYLQSRP